MKFLHEFDDFRKLVVSRAEMDTLTVADAIDYGRTFFDASYEQVSDRLDKLERNGAISIENGRITT